MATVGLLVTSLVFLVYLVSFGSLSPDEGVSDEVQRMRKNPICPHRYARHGSDSTHEQMESVEDGLLKSKHRSTWHGSRRRNRRSAALQPEVKGADVDRRRQLYNEFLRRVLRKNKVDNQNKESHVQNNWAAKEASSVSNVENERRGNLEDSKRVYTPQNNEIDRRAGRYRLFPTTTLNPLRPSRQMDAEKYRQYQRILKRKNEKRLQRMREIHQRRFKTTTTVGSVTSQRRFYTTTTPVPETTDKPMHIPKTKTDGSPPRLSTSQRKRSKYGFSKNGKPNVVRRGKKKSSGKSKKGNSKKKRRRRKKNKKRKGNKKRKKSRASKNAVDTRTDPFISESKAKDYLTSQEKVMQRKKRQRRVILKGNEETPTRRSNKRPIASSPNPIRSIHSTSQGLQDDTIFDVHVITEPKRRNKAESSAINRNRLTSRSSWRAGRLGKGKKTRKSLINKKRIARIRRNRLKLKLRRKRKNRKRKNRKGKKNRSRHKKSTVIPSTSPLVISSFSSSSSSVYSSSTSSSPSSSNVVASTMKQPMSAGSSSIASDRPNNKPQTATHEKTTTSEPFEPHAKVMNIDTPGIKMSTAKSNTADSTSGSPPGKSELVESSKNTKIDRELESITKYGDKNTAKVLGGNINADHKTTVKPLTTTVSNQTGDNNSTGNLAGSDTLDNTTLVLNGDLKDEIENENKTFKTETSTAGALALNTEADGSDNNTNEMSKSQQTTSDISVVPTTSSSKLNSRNATLGDKKTPREETNRDLSIGLIETTTLKQLRSSLSSTSSLPLSTPRDDAHNMSMKSPQENPPASSKAPPSTTAKMLTFALATYGNRETSSTTKPQENIASASSKDPASTTSHMLTFDVGTFSDRQTSSTTLSEILSVSSTISDIQTSTTSKKSNSRTNKWLAWAKRPRNRKNKIRKKSKSGRRGSSRASGVARGSVAISLAETEENASASKSSPWVLTTRPSSTTTKGPFIGYKTAYDFLSNQKGLNKDFANEDRRESSVANGFMGENMCEIFNKHYVPTRIGGKCV